MATRAIKNGETLPLLAGASRKKSEVEMFMTLHYADKIRETVKERWKATGSPGLQVGAVEGHELLDSRDDWLVKDPTIPITFKKAIARELFKGESEAFKCEIRAHIEAWTSDGRTVRTNDEDERLELVRDYKKYVRSRLYRHHQHNVFPPRNVPLLARSIAKVLRNAEDTCSTKGITWLACPDPSNKGEIVAH